MAETIHYRFTVRGGTAAALAARNEIPLSRELVAQIDTGLLKLGDGVTRYNDLPYIGGGGTVEMQFRTHEGWVQISQDAGQTWDNMVALDDIRGPEGPEGPPGPPGPASSAYFGATFDGGNAEIAPGAYADVRVPYGCRLTKVSVLADQVGTLVVGVWAVPWVQFPPTNADSITGASPPAIFGGNKYESTDFTNWRDEIESGEVIRFYVLQAAGVTRGTVLIEGVRE